MKESYSETNSHTCRNVTWNFKKVLEINFKEMFASTFSFEKLNTCVVVPVCICLFVCFTKEVFKVVVSKTINHYQPYLFQDIFYKKMRNVVQRNFLGTSLMPMDLNPISGKKKIFILIRIGYFFHMWLQWFKALLDHLISTLGIRGN